MMTGRLRVPLGYSPDMEARVLELPLITRRISIFLLLPDDMERGLAAVEANARAGATVTSASIGHTRSVAEYLDKLGAFGREVIDAYR